MPAPPPVENVKIGFGPGQLRQPSLWGKVLEPGGTILEYSDAKDVDVAIDKKNWIITFPSLPEGTYLIFGARGYYAAGQLSSCAILFQARNGQSADWQFPGHLVRFQTRQAVLLAQGEETLEPIYTVLSNNQYPKLAKIQELLRKENRDKSPAKNP